MQGEFDFETASNADSYEMWLRERRERMLHYARENGLPLNHACRVELVRGVVVSGTLRLAEDRVPMTPGRDAAIALRIGDTKFLAKDILSLVRTD